MSVRRLPLLLFFVLSLFTTVQSAEQIDINTADKWSLARVLDGVGPKKAAAIVEFRNKNGPFKSVYDLENVYGIGPKTIEKNRDRIIVSVPKGSPKQPEKKE